MMVPDWVYKRVATGEVSLRELEDLEKFASNISATGKAGARAVVKDPSNNLDDVLANVAPKDRDDVLRALRQMKKEAQGTLFRNLEHLGMGVGGAGLGAIGGAMSDDENRLRNAMLGAGVGLGAGHVGYNVIDPSLFQGRARLMNKAFSGQPISKEEAKALAMRESMLKAPVYAAAGAGGYLAGKGMSGSKEASYTKSRLTTMAKEANLAQAKELMDAHGLAAEEALREVYPRWTEEKIAAGVEQLKYMDKDASGCAGGHSKTKKRLKKMTKKANNYIPAAAIMGGAMMAPIVSNLSSRAINALTQKSDAQIQQDLKRILQIHPDLGRANDPRVQMAYSTLVRLNPEYAEDPLIAGPLLKQIIESRMDPMNPNSASYLDAGVAKNLSDARSMHLRGENMASGGFGDAFGESVGQGTRDAITMLGKK